MSKSSALISDFVLCTVLGCVLWALAEIGAETDDEEETEDAAEEDEEEAEEEAEEGCACFRAGKRNVTTSLAEGCCGAGAEVEAAVVAGPSGTSLRKSANPHERKISFQNRKCHDGRRRPDFGFSLLAPSNF